MNKNLEILLKDFKELGLPKIHNYCVGFNFVVQIENYKHEEDINNLVLNEQFSLSLNEIELVQVKRPSNIVLKDIKKCYLVRSLEDKEKLCWMFWN